MPDDIAADPSAAIAGLRRELAEARAERDAALAREAAIAEVLGVINASPGDLGPVFDAIVEKARRLSGAAFGALRTFDGELFHLVAAHGGEPDEIARLRELGPIDHRNLSANGHFARLVQGERVVHIADMRELDGYRASTEARERIDLRGIRTLLAVALRKDDALLGAIIVHRQEVRPFSEREMRLIGNFADQAVIAMENARLITETREALEQQTATAEVLGVINASPGDLTPVFDAMVEKAKRLCEASQGVLRLYDGEGFHLAGAVGEPPVVARTRQLGPIRRGLFAPLTHGEELVHIFDVRDTDT